MTEIPPPPVHEHYEDTIIGNWCGYDVIKNHLVTHITDVTMVNIEPDDELATLPLIDTDRDEDLTGVALMVQLPEWNRYKQDDADYEVDMFHDEYVRQETFQFSHPVEVSHGWDSPWHPLAALKRNNLYDDAPLEQLAGCRVMAQHIGGNEWSLSVESPLSVASGSASLLEQGEEELAYDL